MFNISYSSQSKGTYIELLTMASHCKKKIHIKIIFGYPTHL